MRDVGKYDVFQLADQFVLDVCRVSAEFLKAAMVAQPWPEQDA